MIEDANKIFEGYRHVLGLATTLFCHNVLTELEKKYGRKKK
jgi:hypothetical protein